MSTAVRKNTTIGVEIEDTEGIYKAPQAETSYVQTLADGFELNPSKELLERNIFTSSIGKTAPRTGMFQVSGTIPTEAKASSLEGGAPEIDALLRSALGARSQITVEVTTKSDGEGSAHTNDTLAIEEADIDKFSVNEIILVKEPGAYHVSPISEVNDDGEGNCTIKLLIPKPSGTFTDGVKIAKVTNYTVADSGHPTLSISKYLEGKVLEKAVGCRVTSMSLENFSTGQIPTFSFAFEGLNFDRSLTVQPHTPSYNSAVPPIALDGRVYMDGKAIDINELSFTLENTLGFKTSIAAENGRVSSRPTERTITGTFNPYKEDDDISNFIKYKANTPFSLFAYAKVPTSTPGEFNQIVAVYMPNCLITELGEADQDGLLQESITFSANRGNTGTINEIYLAFI